MDFSIYVYFDHVVVKENSTGTVAKFSREEFDQKYNSFLGHLVPRYAVPPWDIVDSFTLPISGFNIIKGSVSMKNSKDTKSNVDQKKGNLIVDISSYDFENVNINVLIRKKI